MKKCEPDQRIPAVILVLLSGDIVRFAILGDKTAFITFSMIAVTFMLVAYMAWKSKMPFLYLVIAAAAFVCILILIFLPALITLTGCFW